MGARQLFGIPEAAASRPASANKLFLYDQQALLVDLSQCRFATLIHRYRDAESYRARKDFYNTVAHRVFGGV